MIINQKYLQLIKSKFVSISMAHIRINGISTTTTQHSHAFTHNEVVIWPTTYSQSLTVGRKIYCNEK